MVYCVCVLVCLVCGLVCGLLGRTFLVVTGDDFISIVFLAFTRAHDVVRLVLWVYADAGPSVTTDTVEVFTHRPRLPRSPVRAVNVCVASLVPNETFAILAHKVGMIVRIVTVAAKVALVAKHARTHHFRVAVAFSTGFGTLLPDCPLREPRAFSAATFAFLAESIKEEVSACDLFSIVRAHSCPGLHTVVTTRFGTLTPFHPVSHVWACWLVFAISDFTNDSVAAAGNVSEPSVGVLILDCPWETFSMTTLDSLATCSRTIGPVRPVELVKAGVATVSISNADIAIVLACSSQVRALLRLSAVNLEVSRVVVVVSIVTVPAGIGRVVSSAVIVDTKGAFVNGKRCVARTFCRITHFIVHAQAVASSHPVCSFVDAARDRPFRPRSPVFPSGAERNVANYFVLMVAAGFGIATNDFASSIPCANVILTHRDARWWSFGSISFPVPFGVVEEASVAIIVRSPSFPIAVFASGEAFAAFGPDAIALAGGRNVLVFINAPVGPAVWIPPWRCTVVAVVEEVLVDEHVSGGGGAILGSPLVANAATGIAIAPLAPWRQFANIRDAFFLLISDFDRGVSIANKRLQTLFYRHILVVDSEDSIVVKELKSNFVLFVVGKVVVSKRVNDGAKTFSGPASVGIGASTGKLNQVQFQRTRVNISGTASSGWVCHKSVKVCIFRIIIGWTVFEAILFFKEEILAFFVVVVFEVILGPDVEPPRGSVGVVRREGMNVVASPSVPAILVNVDVLGTKFHLLGVHDGCHIVKAEPCVLIVRCKPLVHVPVSASCAVFFVGPSGAAGTVFAINTVVFFVTTAKIVDHVLSFETGDEVSDVDFVMLHRGVNDEVNDAVGEAARHVDHVVSCHP